MNRFIGSGYIGKNGFELRTTSTGKMVVSYSLALPTREKGKYDYINCVSWNGQAEFLKNNEDKIKSLMIEAHVTVRSYESNGSKKYVTEFVTDNVEVKEWNNGDTVNLLDKDGSLKNDFFPVEDDDIPF